MALFITLFMFKTVNAQELSGFKFTKSSSSIRAIPGSEGYIDLQVPKNYDKNDIEIVIANGNILKLKTIIKSSVNSDSYIVVFTLGNNYGSTTVQAKLKNTEYATSTTVKTEDSIQFKVKDKSVGKTVTIDSKCDNMMFSIDTTQAIEISVTKLKNSEEEKWFRLGQGIYGEPLNNQYSYDITENSIITVRWIIWWNSTENANEPTELYRQSLVIDDLEPISSIGAKIKIHPFGVNNINVSYVTKGSNLDLDVDLIEMDTSTPVVWTSYRENVATVNESGVVNALRKGTAIIEAKTNPTNSSAVKYTDVYPVIVLEDGQMHIAVETGGLAADIPNEIGVNAQAQAILYDAANEVRWESSNAGVVSITNDGVIKGLENGTAVITASVISNGHTYTMADIVKVGNGVDKVPGDDTSGGQSDYVSIPDTAKEINYFVLIIGLIAFISGVVVVYNEIRKKDNN